MKNLLVLAILILFSASSFAAEVKKVNKKEVSRSNLTLNLFLGAQFRFEDSTDQNRSLKTYSNYSLSSYFLDDYMIAIEANKYKEGSGNSSLKIDREFNEYDLAAGYSILNVTAPLGGNWNFIFNLFAVGYIGQNKLTIETTLLGVKQKDNSSAEWAYGAGVVASARIRFFIIELDTRVMASKSYEPQTLSVSAVRTGFAIPLN